MKWFKIALILIAILLAMPAGTADSQAPPRSPWDEPGLRARIEPALLKQLVAGGPNERWPVIVTLRQPAAADQAGEQVTRLRAVAARSQRGVQAFLAEEQAAGRVDAVRSFWIFNGLALQATPQTIGALAARDDVELVRQDRYQPWLQTAQRRLPTLALRFPSLESAQPAHPASIEWGVKRVRADQVWATYNNTGEGVSVATLDTGVDYQHPALNANYRGNAGKGLYDHHANWFDATDANAQYPVDSSYHGTHVMGILAGQDGIGVAPGARWIAVRIFDSRGYAYNSWIHAGFEWILAPGGDPALAPDVLSNSWGSVYNSLTDFEPDLAQLRQAGIFVTFSAGNYGPTPGSINSPASLPGVFAVGASDYDDEVASFSSRGPSPWGEIKPHVVAPGVAIRSSIPGGTYDLLDGTSMAAPHAAGVAALMLAAKPSLSITATAYALTNTAVPLTTSVPNNSMGWGLVNAYAAVQAVAGAGTLSGLVVNAVSRLPLPGATVTVHSYESGRVFSAQADGRGQFTLGLAAGPYTATASLFGYAPGIDPLVIVITGQTTLRTLAATPLPVGMVRGVLTDSLSGQPVTATITVLDTPISHSAYGEYLFDLPVGAYTMQVRQTGYRVVSATVSIASEQVTRRNFALVPTPRVLLVNSGAWYYQEYPTYFRQALDEMAYAYDEWRIKHLPGDVPTADALLEYNIVIWSSPQDSPGYVKADSALETFLSNGGKLVLTGQDIAFWDGGGSGLFSAAYLYHYLKTRYVMDDAGIRTVSGLPADLMGGLSFGIADGDGANNQDWPDVIAVSDANHARQILAYPGVGSAGQATGLCLPYRAVVLPFGYEGIGDDEARHEVMSRTLAYLTGPRQAEGLNVAATSPKTQVNIPGTLVTFTAQVYNTGEAGGRVTYTVQVESQGWTASVSPTQLVLSPCASAPVTVQVSISPALVQDTRNTVTLTVQAVEAPLLAYALTFTAKTPAPLLVVDDDRWYNVESAYTRALDQIGVPYDVWQVAWSGSLSDLNGPPLERMAWYPIVVWFTGYDWYLPLSNDDEEQLSAYLDSGGRLMLSSTFYLDLGGYWKTFARQRLGVMNYTYGMTATHTYGSPAHPLGRGLNQVALVNPFPRAGFFTLDYALVPSAQAESAWRGDHHRAHAIANQQAGSRVIFWGIPFEALPDGARAAALRRSLGWLGALGDSSVEIDPAVISPGGSATVSLAVRNNMTDTTAAVTLALPPVARPDPLSLPPGMTYAPLSNTLSWSGDVEAGDAHPLAFRVTISPAATTAHLPVSVVFRDQTTGIEFDQPLALRIDTSDLQGACGQPQLDTTPIRPLAPATVTLRTCNSGLGAASDALVVGLAPLGVQVVSGTASVEGPGTAWTTPGGVMWQGALDAGQSITVSYRITAPFMTRSTRLPLEMLTWDGNGGAWEKRVWVKLWQSRTYLPLILK